MKVAMIGCGKLGTPCANVMFRAGHDVVGYDAFSVTGNEFPMVSTLRDAVQDRRIIFIAVPTPHDPEYGGEKPTSSLPAKDFDYSIVQSVLNELRQHVTPDQLVVLISTVLPGTIRGTLEADTFPFRFVYNPYLIAMGSVEWDMVNPDMIIIGTKDGDQSSDANILIDFYESFIKNIRYEIGTWTEAEAIKIFYNTFISTKIAFVNTIMDVAEALGDINVDVVTKALARSTKRITSPAYMKAGMGDGGACHPRDGIALSYLSDTLGLDYDFFGHISYTREKQAQGLAFDLFVKSMLREDFGLSTNVYIHGKTYKPGVPYTDGSYSLLIGHYLKTIWKINPIYVDPLTNDHVDVMDGIILMAHHAATTYSHAKLIGTEHQAFYAPIASGSLVVDPWRYLTEADLPEGVSLHSYGNTRST